MIVMGLLLMVMLYICTDAIYDKLEEVEEKLERLMRWQGINIDREADEKKKDD